jgi:Glycosyl transferase family 2
VTGRSEGYHTMLAFDIALSRATPLPVVEAAHAIGRALQACGCQVDVMEDRLPAVRANRVTLVLAPHEVYPNLEASPGELDRSLANTILICTARPSAVGWDRSLRYATRARAVLDISDAGVTAFATAGLPVQRFRIGYEPTIDLSVGGIETRPLDVVFLGTATPRRLRLMGAAAPFLSRHDIDLRFTEGVASRANPVDGFVSGDAKYRLLAGAKIALNLHPADDPLFEWLRVREAIANGCLLVSELSSGATPLDPGRHFVSVDHGHLGATLERLLDEPARLEEIRATGAAFFREDVRLVDSAQTILEAAEGHARRRRHAPPSTESSGAGPAADPATPTVIDPIHAEIIRQNAVLKRLFVEIRGLRREVAHVRHSVEDPGAPLVRTTTTPGWDASTPREVSVIVTLYNYGRFVREAIESALASEDVGVEVIVIDDRSADDGPSIVHQLIEERPDAAIRFLEQRVNTGVQRARNLAFAQARSPFAFVLDADNAVYPRGIAKLRDALARDRDAAFAYGIIERFNDEGSLGLMGLEGWDERRLARSHYIDAMALVRVDVWREVGGYVTDPALELGWEDYDLWLNFASHGYRGVHVREIIGRYRVHGISSLAITTLDTDDLMGRLQARHSRFFRAARPDST